MYKSYLLLGLVIFLKYVGYSQMQQELLLDDVKIHGSFSLNGGAITYLKSAPHPSGDVILAGTFTNSVNLHPGTDHSTVSSFGFQDIFISRIRPDSTVVFIRTLQNANECWLNDLKLDNDGNILISGAYNDSLNFSPGSVGGLLKNEGRNFAFIAKYNAAGGFLFTKQITSTVRSAGGNIAVHSNGTIGWTGTFSGKADLNPGPDSLMINVGINSAAMFCSLFSANGNYMNGFSIRPTVNPVSAPNIGFDPSGDIILAGDFFGLADFNPLPLETYNLNATSLGSSFIASYTPSATLNYVLQFSSNRNIKTEDLKIDNGGNIYLTGNFAGTVDFDPGPGIANKSSIISWSDMQDIFLLKITQEGYFSWVHVFGSAMNDAYARIVITPNNNVALSGYFGGNVDMDPGPGTNIVAQFDYRNFIIAEYSPAGNFARACNPFFKTVHDFFFFPSFNVTQSGNYWATDVIRDPNVSNSVNKTDGLIIRCDSIGQNNFNGIIGKISPKNSYTVTNFCHAGNNGNVYMAGKFEGIVEFPSRTARDTTLSAIHQSVFVSRYDKSGNCVFAFKLGATSNRNELTAMETDGEGNVYLFGTTQGNFDFDPGPAVNLADYNNESVAFMAKYDSMGKLVLVKRLGLKCNIRKVIKQSDGSFNIMGTFSGPINFYDYNNPNIYPTGSPNIFYTRISPTGNCIKFWKIRNSGLHDFSNDPEGNIYVSGKLNSTINISTSDTPFEISKPAGANGYTYLYLAKYDTSGNVKYGFSLAELLSENGTSTISANSSDGAVLIKADFKGKFDADPGPGQSIISDFDLSSYDYPQFIAHYDSLGGHVSANNIHAPQKKGIYIGSIIRQPNGSYYLFGGFSRPGDFQIGQGDTIIYKAPGSLDADFSMNYIAKYQANGKLIYVKTIGGESLGGTETYLTVSGNRIVVSGGFDAQANLSPAKEPYYANSDGITRGYISLASEFTKYVTINDGFWNDPNTWAGGVVPEPGQIVTIKHLVELQGNTTVSVLEIMPGANLEIAPGGRLTILR